MLNKILNNFDLYWIYFAGAIIVFFILIYLLMFKSFSWEKEVIILKEEKHNVIFEAEFPTDVHSLDNVGLSLRLQNNNNFQISLSQPIKYKLFSEDGEILMEDDIYDLGELGKGFKLGTPSPFRYESFPPGNYILKIYLPGVLIKEQEVDFELEETTIRVKTTLEEIFG